MCVYLNLLHNGDRQDFFRDLRAVDADLNKKKIRFFSQVDIKKKKILKNRFSSQMLLRFMQLSYYSPRPLLSSFIYLQVCIFFFILIRSPVALQSQFFVC